MSESLCKLIQRYEDKRYYGLCVLSFFLLMWFVVAFTGFTEILSLFSNKHLGLIEAFLFTQIDLLSFQRSGIEILPNNSWRSVSNDTFLNSFKYWYNAIYLVLWFTILKLLTSKPLNSLILGLSVSDTVNSIKLLYTKIKVILSSIVSSLFGLIKREIENLKKIDGIKYNPQNASVNDNTEAVNKNYYGEEPTHKECPFCCEQILYRAIKCKHCGSDLNSTLSPEIKRQRESTDFLNKHYKVITWKHYAASGVIIFILLVAGFNKSNSSSTKLDKGSAQTLCKRYIAKLMYKSTSIIKTNYIKYDGGHFVKAYYRRAGDGDYFEYVCSLDNNTIVWAGVFNGSDLGRWRYEDEMNYKRSESGSWVLY